MVTAEFVGRYREESGSCVERYYIICTQCHHQCMKDELVNVANGKAFFKCAHCKAMLSGTVKHDEETIRMLLPVNYRANYKDGRERVKVN